jgi:hypothetical protein
MAAPGRRKGQGMSTFPTSFDRDDLLKCARGELFGPGNAQLPEPPMLMMDRITDISEDGASTARAMWWPNSTSRRPVVLRLPLSPATRSCPAVSASTGCGS